VEIAANRMPTLVTPTGPLLLYDIWVFLHFSVTVSVGVSVTVRVSLVVTITLTDSRWEIIYAPKMHDYRLLLVDIQNYA